MIDPRELLRHIPNDVLLEAVKARGLIDDILVPAGEPVRVGNLAVDPAGLAVWRGRTVRLSRRETGLLYALARLWSQGQRAVPGKRLAPLVFRGWDAHGGQQAVRECISRLRLKAPGLIESRYGKGYSLNVDVAQEDAA